jgi:hypothetical protein
MQILLPFFCLALIAVATDGAAQGASTRWDHNGSLVSLSATGARRQFHYQSPAADLLQIGVQPGTLLFDGRKVGNTYSGTAYVFSKVCGALPYTTEGPVTPDQRTVTMYGKAPIVDSTCSVIQYRDDVLVFSLSPEITASTDQSPAEQIPPRTVQTIPIRPPSDSEYDRFLEQWKVCFDIGRPDQTTSARISQCDEALSYPRLTYDDRARLLTQRATLVDRVRLQKPIGVPQGNGESSPSIPSGTQSRFFDRISDVPPESVAALVIAVMLIGLLWLANRPQRRGVAIENTQAEVPSRTTNRPSEAAPGQQASMFESSLEAHVPDKRPPDSGDGSQVPAVLGNPLESYNLTEPPSQSMSLKLKRSERRHLTGKIIFMLDARIGLNAEAHALIEKHRLGSFVVYDSQARERHREATKEHLETTREHPPWSGGMAVQLLGLGKTFYRLGRASVSATMTALSLRITVDKLIRGVHVECDSMDELLGAERAIKEAATNLKGYLEEAATFDGREEVVEL